MYDAWFLIVMSRAREAKPFRISISHTRGAARPLVKAGVRLRGHSLCSVCVNQTGSDSQERAQGNPTARASHRCFVVRLVIYMGPACHLKLLASAVSPATRRTHKGFSPVKWLGWIKVTRT